MKIKIRLWTLVSQIAVLLVVLLGLTLASCDSKADLTETLPQQVSIPINAENADNIGSLHLELAYDPAVLEPIEVEKGMLAGSAMLESNIDVPGRVVIGMIDTSGINGNGSLAVISFNVVGTNGITSALTLEEVAAHDAASLIDVPTRATSGSFTVEDRSFTAPVILFSP